MRGKRWLMFLGVVAAVVCLGRSLSNSRTESGSGQLTEIALAAPHAKPIPKQALRLRILANSDSAADQALKREVRDAVVVQVAQWLAQAKTPQQAEAILRQHLPEVRTLADHVVEAHGFRYDVKADIGRVPFPTKVYGNQVYPAGDYEALRITIGRGAGANWWCVLFPPLCFVDIADGDAVPNTGGFPDLPPLETIDVPNAAGGKTQVAIRLASVDYGEELWRTVHHWFSQSS
ncbi:stage II sporulation protein R [Alicyclobacillus herbarius]|uniref:stage II sporulation protein R n=1 Tax=Alicyclobacillus herbarius TaxID=122960 RepID=UPI00047DFC96|nr:stage II sporulation protein R [Alicyclobacillus herbarius]